MSKNQKPRWPTFYPRMKHRGKYRKKYGRIVVWDSDWNPVAWYKTTDQFPFRVSGLMQEIDRVLN